MGSATWLGSKATFSKLRDGSWGMRVNGAAHRGDYVLVVKKDGTEQMKMIGAVLWADGLDKDRISICTIGN